MWRQEEGIGNKIRVALIQLETKLGQVEQNRCRAAEMLNEAGERGTRLAVLPELSTTGFCLGVRFREAAEPIPGETTRFFGEIARKHQMSIVFGLPERGEIKGVIYNSATLIDERGAVAGKFRKLHVTLYLHTANFLDEEREYFSPGYDLPVFRTNVADIGMLVCQDGDYPEPYRVLALKGAEIITLLVNTPVGFEEMWWKLYCAHAYMNGLFVAVCNKVGNEEYDFHGSRQTASFCGGSYIADPLGQIVCKGGDKEQVVYAEIDLGDVERARWATKLMRDFRPELYGRIIERNASKPV